MSPENSVVDQNSKVVNQFIEKHRCKRCGVYGLGQDPKNFLFFELHLPDEERVINLVDNLSTEELIKALGRRDLFCRECYPHIERFYKEGIPLPPVRLFSTDS